MAAVAKTMEKQKKMELEDFLQLMDTLREEPVKKEPEKESPTKKDKRERAILLTMLGLL